MKINEYIKNLKPWKDEQAVSRINEVDVWTGFIKKMKLSEKKNKR